MAIGASDGTIITAMTWHQVDPHVFSAFEQFTHERVESLWDLAKVVDLKGYDTASEHFQRAMGGHVSEFMAQDHLAAAGINTTMPEAANNPAFDLQHGQEWTVNVKDYADLNSSGIADHFGAHPDVPILVPSDAQHIPSDAVDLGDISGLDQLAGAHVVVDPWLDHGDGLDALTDAFALIDPHVAASQLGDSVVSLDVAGVVGALDIGVPIVTIVMSGHREFEILQRGDTRLERALMNVGLDAGGVAVGAAVGGKGGAAVGFLVFGPVGAVLGGVVGGIGGAIAGKMAASSVRTLPLRQAREAYVTERAALGALVDNVERDAKREWQQALNAEQEATSRELATVQAQAEQVARSLEAAANARLALTPAEAEAMLTQAETSMRTMIHAAEAAWPGSGPWNRTVRWWGRRRTSRNLEAWRRLTMASGDDPSQVCDAVLAAPCGPEIVAPYSDRVIRTHASTYQQLARLQQGTELALRRTRLEASERLNGRWAQIRGSVQRRLEPAVGRVRAASDRLESELRAAGVEPHAS